MTSLTVHYNYVLFGFFPFSCFYWDIWVFICWYSTRTILNYKLEYCIGLLQRLLFKYLLSKTKVIFRIHKKSFSRKKHVIYFLRVFANKKHFFILMLLLPIWIRLIYPHTQSGSFLCYFDKLMWSQCWRRRWQGWMRACCPRACLRRRWEGWMRACCPRTCWKRRWQGWMRAYCPRACWPFSTSWTTSRWAWRMWPPRQEPRFNDPCNEIFM